MWRGQRHCQNAILCAFVLSPTFIVFSSCDLIWHRLFTIMPIGLLACLPAFLVSLRPVLLATAHMPYHGSARGRSAFNDTLLCHDTLLAGLMTPYWQVS